MFKVLIASDRTNIRDHLKAVCKTHGFCICGEATDPEQALVLSELHIPNIVIFNFRCSVRIQTSIISQISQISRTVKVLICSSMGLTRTTRAYVRAGACGFISEESETDEVHSVLRGMAAGFTLIPMKALKQPKIKLAHRSNETFIALKRAVVAGKLSTLPTQT
jgi:two-component system chemotaxis response regulator CheY